MNFFSAEDKIVYFNINYKNLIFTFSVILLFTSCYKEYEFSLEGLNSKDYIIAHRGNWGENNSPPNSRAALKDALELDIYGVEFDVRQTADDVIVISHDPIYNSKQISMSSYEELVSLALHNGESLPTIDDFFSIYKTYNTDIRLVIDIKDCDLKLLFDKISFYNLLGKVEFISFNQNSYDQLKEYGYDTVFSYLSGDKSPVLSPQEVINQDFKGVAYYNNVLYSNTSWINDCKNMGLKLSVWTENDLYKIKYYVESGVKVITDKSWQCARKSKLQ